MLLLGLPSKAISSWRVGATIFLQLNNLRDFTLNITIHALITIATVSSDWIYFLSSRGQNRTGPGPSSFLRFSSPHLLLAVIRRRRNSGGTGPSSPLVPQFCISLFADIRVGPAASSSDGRSGRRGQGVRRRIRRRRRSGRSRPPVRHGQGIFLSLFSSILASYAPFSRNFYLRSWLVLFQAFSHVRSKRRGLIST